MDIFYYVLIVIWVVILYVLGRYYLFPEKVHEHFEALNKQLSYYKCPKLRNHAILESVFQKAGIKRTYNKDQWDFYIPCGYNFVEKELKGIYPKSTEQKIFGIKGCDRIVSKNSLWKILHGAYGRQKAKEMMPDTYVLFDERDMKEFETSYEPNQLYLLKKNIQRKLGIHLTKDYQDIMSKKNTDFRVVQKYINNLFLIDKRKINLRIYLLVTCFDGVVSVYMHRRGRCIYSNKDFDENTLDPEVHLTSLNLDIDVYKTRPFDLTDLRAYLGENIFYGLMNDIVRNLIDTMRAAKPFLCQLARLRNNESFQLFGLDYVFDENFHPYLLEMNKGPEMTPKNEKDRVLKEQVLTDVFRTVHLVSDDSNNEFIKLEI
jgi:hypothetical protein